jgi:four helix bundle protein
MAAMALKTYRDLEAWQKGMDLAVAAYKLGRLCRANERFGLANQLQRAAASIPANLAEGYARRGRGEHVYFVSVARGPWLKLRRM